MGLVYALGAYLSWGLLVPVHFRMLGAFSPNHILAERIVWSSLFAGALALALALDLGDRQRPGSDGLRRRLRIGPAEREHEPEQGEED